MRRQCLRAGARGKRHEDWQLDDPAGQDVDAVRVIRDEIDQRVQELISELLPE